MRSFQQPIRMQYAPVNFTGMQYMLTSVDTGAEDLGVDYSRQRQRKS